jgi:hypothetical protein
MKFELTDQQVRAVKQGHPVEVVDSASECTFVVVAREAYGRVPPLVEGNLVQGPSPPTAPTASAEREEAAVRVRLDDLATPAEVTAETEEWCKKYGWRGKTSRHAVEERLKLQYYYGGQGVYLLPTPAGLVVVPIPERYKDTPDLRYVLLSAEERLHATLEFPAPWQDTTSEILI